MAKTLTLPKSSCVLLAFAVLGTFVHVNANDQDDILEVRKVAVPGGSRSGNKELPYDLIPVAQSYFIIPETPTTTTVKPTFTRRKTKRPITSDKEKAERNSNVALTPQPPLVNFNPFAQLLDTGFQSGNINRRQSQFQGGTNDNGNKTNNKKRPSSVEMLMRRQNNNEGGVTTTSSSSNYNYNDATTSPPSSSVSLASNYNINQSGNDQRRFAGGRKPKKPTAKVTVDYAGLSQSQRNKKIVNVPGSGGGRRYINRKNNGNNQQDDSSTVAGTTPAIPHLLRNANNGNGRRQFGGGRSKSTKIEETSTNVVPINPVDSDEPQKDRKPLRRRKKFTSTTSGTTTTTLRTTDENGNAADGSFSNNLKINPTFALYGNRKPFQFSTSTPLSLNPIENAQETNIIPVARRMRQNHKPRAKGRQLLLLAEDSAVESSDAITVLAEGVSLEQLEGNRNIEGNVEMSNGTSVGVEGSGISDVVNASSSSNSSDLPHVLPSSPRNLSNRSRPGPPSGVANPLDRLTNRQAAARRFLTPKNINKTEITGVASTTSKPSAPIAPRAPRPSPFSLMNLRNRRLGGSTTTSTTEAPEEVSNPEAGGNPVQNGNETDSSAHCNNGTLTLDSNNSTSNSNSTSEGSDSDQPQPQGEEETIPKSPLLRGRRPPLLRRLQNANQGNFPATIPIPIKPLRGSILKPKTTEVTTPKPTNVETTTQPSCEEGKRYNQVLRKCIPSFNPKSILARRREQPS